MKLFLSSTFVNDLQAAELLKLVGKNSTNIQLALIENASDKTPKESKDWVYENREMITGRGIKVELVDLRKFENTGKLKAKLAEKDVIWCGGGNTYYLRWILHKTGADNIIRELVEEGTVYGGGSAGAIIAGPTLRHFETADDPGEAPVTIWEGLNFTDSVVVPHFDYPGFASDIFEINDRLLADGYKTVPLSDEKVLIINQQREKIL